MKVYMSPIELHYFKCGDPCVAFADAPNIAVPESIVCKTILVCIDEVLERLPGGRLLIQKKY